MFGFLNILFEAFKNYWQVFVEKSPALILALAIFFVFWIAARAEKIIIQKVIGKLEDKEKIELTVLFDRLTRLGMLTLGIIIALSVAGVNLTALITGLGLMGFALSFAFQDYIKNFLGGIIILTQKPFIIGDQIEIDEISGVVKSIEMRFTVLKTFDGKQILISNSDAISKAIILNTAYATRQSKIKIFLEHKPDLRDSIGIITKAIKDTEGVQGQPEPKVLIDGVEGKKIKLNFFYWTKSSKENELLVRSLVIENISRILEKENLLGEDLSIR
jgi:small-conductance mechanosensitive channel